MERTMSEKSIKLETGETVNLEWDGDDDPENPFNWSKTRKWITTLTVCTGTFLAAVNATAYATVAPEVGEEFGVYDTASFPASFWPVTAWNAGAAALPTILLPFCENFGLRWTYLTTYVLFFIFVIPQALAQNFATLIVIRFIAGCLGGTLLNICGGIIADIFSDERQRNLPITIFVFALVFGVTTAPVIAGAIATRLSWRWIFYVQLIMYGAWFPIVVLVIKETRGIVILRQRFVKRNAKRSAQHDTERSNSITLALSRTHSSKLATMPPMKSLLREVLVRPTFLFCTQPVVFFFSLWSAFSFGLIFISTQSTGVVFTSPKTFSFTEPQAGMVLGSMAIGMILGFFACVAQDAYHTRSALRNDKSPGQPIPEARLPLSIPSSLFGLAGGLFVYGWTSYPGANAPWIAPAVGLAMQGFGIMVVIHAVANYVTDSYAGYAASSVAAIAFCENTFAATLPLAANAMYNRLGFQWASTLLGCVAVLLSCVPAALMWKGEWVRSRSRFMEHAGAGVLSLP